MLRIFICSFTICMSFLGKSLFKSFAYFVIVLLGLYTVDFEEFFVILDTSPLSGRWFANIFSQSVVCTFILLTKQKSFTELKFSILRKPNYSFFSSMDCANRIVLQNCQTWSHADFPTCFLLEVLWRCTFISILS